MNTKKFLEYIQEFRKKDADIQSQTIAVFLFVGINENNNGVLMTSIADNLKMKQSSVSRNVSLLAKWTWRTDKDKKSRIPGLDFVEAFEDPMERRRKLVRLTPKGKIFFSKFN